MALASPRSALPPPPAFKQRRAARTYDALLEAAGQVFAERGFDGAQTPDIAAAAGVSTGALYRYFKDKRHLFVELLRHHLAHARAEVAARLDPARFAGSDVRVALETVVEVILDLTRENSALTRVFTAASLTDPDVAKLRATSEADDRSMLAQTIASLVPPELVPNPLAAALVIQLTVFEVALDRAGVRPTAGSPIADRDVKRALCDMLLRYLHPAEVLSASAPGASTSPRRRRKVK